MKSKKILFISQEITPYLPESEMSLIGRQLPQGIQERGKEIRTFMPRFGTINERRNQLHEVIRLSGMNLIINDIDHPLIIKVASIQSARMQVYFIDNEDYFHGRNLFTDDNGKFFEDNDERIIFFARGVLETVKKLRWSPDIVHCHGWITSLIPLYIKQTYSDDPIFSHSKIVYSLYNEDFPDLLRKDFKKKVKMEGITDKDLSLLNVPNYINLTKLATKMSDGIIIGSKNLKKEIKEHVITNEKYVLEYQDPDNYIDTYSNFYDKLLTETVNDSQ